ncbi:MAG: type II toxin-antitoxin system prevent-host-death family antitoxin [Candidatus Fermentibacteraceae bacterium]|nr:type II toxin-antitoxin system prevent-host-death family antitoxin [Candidatus Fermentibacteraceae bacterium]
MKTEIVTRLKREATAILAELNDTREPVLITQYGKPSAYLVDADDYEMMQERMRILEGISAGERAVSEKNTLSEKDARQYMKKWLN